ncbi:MAG TPA: hypothetical protein VHC20_01430 [Candidatus Paceibacterota bacterium]|nr:hypothetical protein [Candidatus Paceibacterota bacterium]
MAIASFEHIIRIDSCRRESRVDPAVHDSDAPQKSLPTRPYRDGRLQEQTQRRAERLDLWTVRLGELAPTAKVLAVVAQDIVMAFAEPRARALHDLASTRCMRRDADVQRPRPPEFIERNLLDATQRIPPTPGVMDDATAAGVDSVVSVSSPAHDKPSAGHELSIHGLTRDDCVFDDASEL